MENKPSPAYYAATVVINSDGQVLLGKRKEDGVWTTPGGGAEPGEMNPAKTAVRELFEEAGIPANVAFLQPLQAIETRNGKLCHVFLYVCGTSVLATSKLDPDQEVNKWKWFKMDEIPNDLKNDPRRFESVRNGYMKFYGIMKSVEKKMTHSEECPCISLDQDDSECDCGAIKKGGKPAQIGEVRNFAGKQYQKMGDGSWKPVVHPEEKQLEQEQNKNKVVSLTDKLKNKISERNEISHGEKHLHDIKNQAVIEGKETRSGKPVFTQVESAMAHGYSSADFREVGNLFYDRAQKMAENISKLELTKQKVDPTFEKIKKENLRLSRSFLSQANRIDDRQSKMAKSYHNEIQQEWLDRLESRMSGYIYGEEPRVVAMDQGDLYLVQVDSHKFSGIFKSSHEIIKLDRMELPSIVQFCLAKGWIEPDQEVNPVIQRGTEYGSSMDYMAGQIQEQERQSELKVLQNFVAQKLSHKEPCPGCEVCQPAPSFRNLDVINARIRMLELVNKLLN